MAEELSVTVTIDRSFGFTAGVTVERGSSILQLKEKLAALDPTGNTKAQSFGIGLSPQSPGEVVRPLPDDTRLHKEHLKLDVCQPPVPPSPQPSRTPALVSAPAVVGSAASTSLAPAPNSGDAAREAARQAARQAQAARREREAATARAKAEEEARRKAEAEATRARLVALAGGQTSHPTCSQPATPPGPWPTAQSAPPPVPTLAGVPVAADTGETRVKGVSADGRYVFAYVGDLKHPHDALALVELFKGEASVQDLRANKARFVYAGGTQDKATSVQVQREVIIEASGLENGDYELASFAHDDMKRQLNRHLTKDNCVVMFGGKCLKIVAQHGI